MKTLLLLGGSRQQLPAIDCARRQGCRTVLCDYLPDNPGRLLADRYYPISTTDRAAVLAVARQEQVDGVIAYASDPAAPTAAFVAAQLGLPGQPLEAVEILTDKELFRAFLADHGFDTPRARAYSRLDALKRDLHDFKLPVIIKPVDSSGSKGVGLIEWGEDLERAFAAAMACSRRGRVIVEEVIEQAGHQVAGDGFSVAGQLVFRCFGNDHFNPATPNPFVPVAASFPCYQLPAVQQRIHREIQRLFDCLKVDTGAYNFDIRIRPDGTVCFLEIGPRCGGNYIPQVIRHATGIDLVDLAVRAALGEPSKEILMQEPTGFWSYWVIYSLAAGRLTAIELTDAIRPHIIETYLNYAIGDVVPAMTGSSGTIGIFIMEFDTMEQMLDLMDHPDRWIRVIVT